jgi:hypothetical protein
MARWEVRRGEPVVSMTEQTEVLVRAKTAGFSGVVIACWGCSGWDPGVSARAFFNSDQGVDLVVLGSEDGPPSPLLVDLLTIGMMTTWTRAINAKGQGWSAAMYVVRLHGTLCDCSPQLAAAGYRSRACAI